MTDPALELRNVVGRSALGELGEGNPIAFRLAAGQVGVILGGKETSSLFRMILGLGKIATGEILLGGKVALNQSSDSTHIQKLRKQVGFGFRDKGLISNLSLRDNVDLPAKYHGHYQNGARAGSLAEAALIELNVEPEVWSIRPSRISSELRKKILLARAIVLSPKVLILDDPSTLVASTFLPELLGWITRQKAKGTAILIGTNDYPFGLAIADWILHPVSRTPVETYDDFVESIWIRSAKLLAERIPRS